MRRVATCWLAIAGLSLVVAPGAAAFIGPFTGVVHGDLDRFQHLENDGDPTDPADDFFSNSSDRYRVRFLYSFRIQAGGRVAGTGNGVYQSATWHLEGKNGTSGSFSCDPPIETRPFGVRVTGHARDGRIRLHFHLSALEHNDEMDCGGDYKALETTSHYVEDSLDFVQGDDGIVVDQTDPRIRPLRRNQTLGPDTDRRVIHHEWEFTIKPPPPPVEPTGGQGPGNAHGPGSPNTDVCTIEGTPRDDRLVGTPDDDVICGFDGDDVIRGRGGNDILVGSFGADRISGGPGRDSLLGNSGKDLLLAKDRKPDFLSGGPGLDSAEFDRRKDETHSIERRL